MADGTGGPDFLGLDMADEALESRVSLRIMATTDMHMHVLPYDYLANRPCDRRGLTRTAGLIALRRAEAANALLFDNGDFLQGNALGDRIAAGADAGINGPLTPGQRGPNPVIAAMNALGYDAMTLGNHDFTFGIPYLRRVVGEARFPITVANLKFRRGPGLPPFIILDRVLRGDDGHDHPIRIGVLGFLPPQTPEWEPRLRSAIACADIVETARQAVPAIRAAGADLVIALAHSGIGDLRPGPGAENCATALAALPGVDAVIAGHTHQVFPGPGVPAAPGVDPVNGTLAGKPAVMAGFGGSHLGIIDLDLRRSTKGGWRIASSASRAEAVDPAIAPLAEIAAPALAAHRETLRAFRSRVGRTRAPLHSFFALLGHDAGLHLVAMAQRWHVRRALAGTRWADLPVLSAAAPLRAGGRGGPAHYTDVPAGALTRRSLTDLYHFPNRVCALEVTGRGLAEWLERSGSIFNRINPGTHDAALIDPDFPSYNFDVITGLQWQVDLSASARFAPNGASRADAVDGPGRIRDLRYRGQAVAPDDRFILATNSYRLAHCGLFGPLAARKTIALDSDMLTREAIGRYVRRRREIDADHNTLNWHFLPVPGASAIFATSPDALAHLHRTPATAQLRIEPVGTDDDGFALLRLHL